MRMRASCRWPTCSSSRTRPRTATELIAYLREHTPERAAVPVALHFVAPMPLTAVGKIFKPALRSDAARRVAQQLLEGLGAGR